MKKIFIILLGILLINITFVTAQESSRRFSIFADPQLSWLTSDTKKFKSDGAVTGFNIGFSADKFFADRYAFSTGLSINNLGGNLKYLVDGKIETRDDNYDIVSGSTVKVKAQYLSLPLGLKFKTNEIGYLTFTAQVGVLGHVRLKGVVWEETLQIDKETATNQFDLFFASYYIGAGTEYSLGGSSSLQAGIIYSNGFVEAYNAGYGKVSIGSLALRIGIVF